MSQDFKRRYSPTALTAKGMWAEFFEAIYSGQPLPPSQYHQISQAFMAGIYTMLSANMLIAEFSEDEACQKLSDLKEELEQFHRERLAIMMERSGLT